MICLAAATQFELQAALDCCPAGPPLMPLLTGVGPATSGITTAAWLGRQDPLPTAVINFGAAGSCDPCVEGGEPPLLELCLASLEVFADLGICHGERMEYFSGDAFPVRTGQNLHPGLLQVARTILTKNGYSCRQGVFLTVSAVSGSRERSRNLAREHEGICENMEGAAVAMACELFQVPCLEIRTISNLAGERDKTTWKLAEACAAAGRAACLIALSLAREGVPA